MIEDFHAGILDALDLDPTGETMPSDAHYLIDRARLLPHLFPYWEAFQILQTSRAIGFGIGYIPLSEILSYCAHLGLTDFEERHHLIQCVKALDAEYVSLVSKRQEEEREMREPSGKEKDAEPKPGGIG